MCVCVCVRACVRVRARTHALCCIVMVVPPEGMHIFFPFDVFFNVLLWLLVKYAKASIFFIYFLYAHNELVDNQ